MQMNGRVFTRLTADKKNIAIKKCKSGMKYTCVVVAMTCPEMFGCQQRKVVLCCVIFLASFRYYYYYYYYCYDYNSYYYYLYY